MSEQSGARRRMCYSFTVLQPSTLRRKCTEHKPGYLHAATQRTSTATATPLLLTHMNVTTNVNGMYLYDFYVNYCILILYRPRVLLSNLLYVPKNPQNCISGGMLKSVKFVIWVHTAANWNGCLLFSLKHKRGAVIAKNVNLPPRLSYCPLYLRSSAFFVHHLVWNTFQWTNNRTNFDVR